MKNKILLAFILITINIFAFSTISAFAETEGMYTYSVSSEGEATIIDCDESISGDIIIPPVIGRFPVIGIGDNAFDYCKGLTSVTIPSISGIISVGDKAFYHCDNLTSVTIGDSVTTIGEYTFGFCTNLTDATIGNNATSIGRFMFDKCVKLANVTIGESVESISDGAFYDCVRLTDINIPDSVTSIGIQAFYNCNRLTDINIPDSVTSIAGSAFAYCSSLTSIIIPDSVISIGGCAFERCSGLVSINIPDSVTSLGYGTFAYCEGLKNVTIPSGVTKIGYLAFRQCNSLKDIYYKGTEIDWNLISIDFTNTTFLKNATIHFVACTKTTISDDGKTFTVTPKNIENGQTIILALYDGVNFGEIQTAIYVGNVIPFTAAKAYKNAKVMVWDSITNMKPICDFESVK